MLPDSLDEVFLGGRASFLEHNILLLNPLKNFLLGELVKIFLALARLNCIRLVLANPGLYNFQFLGFLGFLGSGVAER